MGMRCLQVPPTVMFHTANAWEEGDEVRLYGCCMNVVRFPSCVLASVSGPQVSLSCTAMQAGLTSPHAHHAPASNDATLSSDSKTF